MNINKKYWLIIDSWNLIESFTTESISPHSFYKNRGFGNTLKRLFSNGGDTINHLILTTYEPKSKFAIEISSELIETSLLETCGKKDTVFSYPKTIYFRKDKVRFRFFSEDLKNGFIAESKILFEVKCVEKYLNSFYVDCEATKKIETNILSNFPFDGDKYLLFDNQINYIKGCIIAYARGQITSITPDLQNLLIHITDLKNTFAGLYTTVMISDEPITDLSCLQKIELSKNEYNQQKLETTNLFDILNQVFQEVIKLASMRSSVLKKQKTPQYLKELKHLQNIREEFQKKIIKIESEYEIDKIRHELDSIKYNEVINGKKKGKSRLYFPKNSPEYQRKQCIKDIIKAFENDNKEYRELKKEIIEIEAKIASFRFGSSEYDSTLGALFVRLSDGVNDLIKKLNKSDTQKSINLSNVKIHDNSIEVMPVGFNDEEVKYFNIVLNYILANPLTCTQVISEVDILNIVSDTGKIYKGHSSTESEIKNRILDILRQYWKYKNQQADTFEIPDNMPILQAIMSFYIKAQGFEQIERLMLNRKYQCKEYAFMLWGAFVGFAAIPKTFTSVLYQNEVADNEIDAFITQYLLNKENKDFDN